MRRKTKNWGRDVYEYTDIKNTSGAKNRGCGRRVKCQELDTEVWETVCSWLDNPDEIAAAAEERTESPFEEVEAQRLEKIKTGRKRLLKLFSSGAEDIGEEKIRQELRDLKEKEEKIVRQLEELHERTKQLEESGYSQNLQREAAEYYLSRNPDELTFKDKRELLRHVVKEVRVFQGKVEIYTF